MVIKHYELAKKIINSWPNWKKNFAKKVIKLATEENNNIKKGD